MVTAAQGEGNRRLTIDITSDRVAHADLVILAREGAANAAAIGKARADLARFGSVPTALVVNRVVDNAAVRGPQGKALGFAS
ncbi:MULTISPECIES: hypothetical protein [unclassified Bradyrhizobium]